jgi:two-component system LytT family response regulator
VTRFHALVADDEPLARAMVANLLRSDHDVERVTECGDARCVRQVLARERVDMAFLDIEMPEVSGLELAESLSPRGPVVVFVTAFNRYAPNAFDVQAIDYVMKPFTDARFMEAVDRAKRRVRERRLSRLADQLALLSAELKDGEGVENTPTAQAPRKLAVDYYVRVHVVDGRHLIRASLATMEQRLSTEQFVRVHRGALVNIEAVRELRDGGNVLLLTDGTIIPISRARKQQVETMFEARFGLGR